MSAIQYTSRSEHSTPGHSSATYEHAQLPSQADSSRIIFTRQLWQQNMPDETHSEQDVSHKSHTAALQGRNNSASDSNRRASSMSLRSRNRSPSPSRGSKTPLTPEESPPFQNTRKRSAGAVEQDGVALHSSNTSPAHTRASSGESTSHVCICQPDPKIPRPRNAFILYRQHHQAAVVAQHPGLANPEISKIIGEQWQNQPAEEKNKWKALAEEEKIRHQQQYPTYRYQPKRNGRRNSYSDQSGSAAEKAKCQKCGGRTTLTPKSPFSGPYSNSVPPTPGSAATPVSRTLPVLRDLSLQSPAASRNGRSYQTNMSPYQNDHLMERDDLGPLSPEMKRRRFNGDHAASVNRTMPPRYGVKHPGTAVGPGTPFPFGQPPPPHPYPPVTSNLRRESLPGFRGGVNPPGPMAPPPRPGMGYQQHRLSQGHIPHDRSLTLPPLQMGHSQAPISTATPGNTVEEQIMNISFRYKIKVLSQVAPPATKSKERARGPLIAIEGDSAGAAKELADWLRDTLNVSDDLTARVIDGPKISASGGKEEVMAQYHRLASEWLFKSKDLLETITMPMSDKVSADSAVRDAISSPTGSSRKIDESYDDTDSESRVSEKPTEADKSDEKSEQSASSLPDSMDVDEDSKRNSAVSASEKPQSTIVKPVSIIANYSLSTSNLVACLIPLGSNDPYSPNDHWQWTATQWRGIIGPDLTIYIRDATSNESGRPPVEIEFVEGRPDVGLFVMRRTKTDAQENTDDGSSQIEASVLRRMGFEVGEWIRAFGTTSIN